MFWLKVALGGMAGIGAVALTVKVVRCPKCGSFHTHKEKELSSEYDVMYGPLLLHGLNTFENHSRKCDDCDHRFHLHKRYVGKGHPNEYRKAA